MPNTFLGSILGIYKHYKGPNYQLLGICYHTETEERLVYYRSLVDGRHWARPYDDFFGYVTVEGKEYKRFTKC